MKTGRMKRFRNIVRELVDNEDFDANRPRAMFLKAFVLFKKSEGIMKRFSDKEHQKLRELFVKTLQKQGVKIKEGLLDTGISRFKSFSSSIVTPEMMRGARGAQLRHDGVLKHDV